MAATSNEKDIGTLGGATIFCVLFTWLLSHRDAEYSKVWDVRLVTSALIVMLPPSWIVDGLITRSSTANSTAGGFVLPVIDQMEKPGTASV
jgi:hypothetical protein